MSLELPSQQALTLVSGLQEHFVAELKQCAETSGKTFQFDFVEWQRNGGKNGGGSRYFTFENEVFNRASINVSHIHYANDPQKKLASATAISSIIHPQNPHAPSLHMHISWTEMKGAANGYWRVMADLNPSIRKEKDVEVFRNVLSRQTPDLYEEACAQGDKYFYIPALDRHRGAAHYYLEQYQSGDPEADLKMSAGFGKAVIACYTQFLAARMQEEVSESDRKQQLEYHTLYLLQVLTLDRGTTSGLLVHNENDLGIMGSLPSRVDRELLHSWKAQVHKTHISLLENIISVLPESGEVSDDIRLALANTVRSFYQGNPDALKYQASGHVIPPTVQNHR